MKPDLELSDAKKNQKEKKSRATLWHVGKLSKTFEGSQVTFEGLQRGYEFFSCVVAFNHFLRLLRSKKVDSCFGDGSHCMGVMGWLVRQEEKVSLWCCQGFIVWVWIVLVLRMVSHPAGILMKVASQDDVSHRESETWVTIKLP